MATTSPLPPLWEADSHAPGRDGMCRDSVGRTVRASIASTRAAA